MPAEFNEKTAFLEAIALKGAEREAYLQRACPDDASRARLQRLVEQYEQSAAEQSGKTTAAAPRPGPTQIDEFRIIQTIGEGGMGTVYLAEDAVLGRRVALKVLASHLTGSETALARFTTEARSTAALNHPGIVPVFKLGFDGVNHYIVSELVDGPTLASLIMDERRRRGAESKTTDLKAWHRVAAQHMLAVADALEATHRANIIHRDVKPSNILIDKVHGARLTDFGIARHLVDQAPPHVTARIGTCHYMSPEQASLAAAVVDQRSDVFSLGVVMYETLTLQRPFEGNDVDQVLRAVIATDPPRVRRLDRSIPKDLETICHKALEKQPERRYQSAAHMAADLRCFLAGNPILAQAPTMGRRAWTFARRNRAYVAPACILILLGIVGAMALTNQRAARAKLGLLIVPDAHAGATVTIARFADDALHYGEPQELGRAPIERYLAPGLYRVRLTQPDGTWREGASLLTPGYVDRFETAAKAVAPAADFLTIPAGSHDLGVERSEPALDGLRVVELPAFRIARCEVSNAEYRAFVIATARVLPPYWATPYDPADDALPVTGIGWEDANAYCRWRGVRMPTPEEWEAAARWIVGRGMAREAARHEPASPSTIPQMRQDYLESAVPVRDPHDPPDTDVVYYMNSNVNEYVEGVCGQRSGSLIAKGGWWSARAAFPVSAIPTLGSRLHYSRDRGFRVALSGATGD